MWWTLTTPSDNDADCFDAREDSHSFSSMVRTLDGLSLPRGFRAEMIGDSIYVRPWENAEHERTANALSARLEKVLPAELSVSPRMAWDIQETGDRLRPDIAVVSSMDSPQDDSEDGNPPWTTPRSVHLVVEVVAPNTDDRDWGRKRWSYGKAGIPWCLIVDAWDGDGAVTLYGHPDSHGFYQSWHRIPAGAELPLPSPLNACLDTAGLFDDAER